MGSNSPAFPKFLRIMTNCIRAKNLSRKTAHLNAGSDGRQD
uniref:Uncharacterized protein n=1 Tax=Magnetospirillum gryphiswaldense TaxID=55518 RepID=A4U290_9PROT|nr:hypothetical protein MGR_0646 [Magnetospirillum gryphiswaldense MSR-1]